MADLTFDGTDIHDRAGIFLDITSGFDDVAEVRGTDVIVPGRAGRTPLSRVKDRRLIELTGYVLGTGATLVLQQQAYRAKIVILQALIAPTGAAKSLVVTTPYMGLPSGSKTISARYLNAIWDVVVAEYFCRVSIQLEAVGNPPDWA